MDKKLLSVCTTECLMKKKKKWYIKIIKIWLSRIPGTGKIWLDDVYCHGNESSIAACNHRGWEVHNCSHFQDIGITCGNSSSSPGILPTLPPGIAFFHLLRLLSFVINLEFIYSLSFAFLDVVQKIQSFFDSFISCCSFFVHPFAYSFIFIEFVSHLVKRMETALWNALNKHSITCTSW